MYRFLLIAIISACATVSSAQEVDQAADSSLHTSDSIRVKRGNKVITVASYAKRFQPRKALLYSAILPGAGQIYNKKYWKLPIVYGGFAGITSVAVYYNNLYSRYKNELFGLLNSGASTSTDGHSEAQLRSAIDQARRQRDFFLILDAFWYLLQIVDAHVDAHLKEFDLNPQLKASLAPSIQQNELTGRTNGFTLTIKF